MLFRSQSGYSYPDAAGINNTVSKEKAVTKGLGNVTINQIDAEGNVIEQWTLINAFVSNVEFGQLSYASEDLVEISVTVVYDYAKLDKTKPGYPA